LRDILDFLKGFGPGRLAAIFGVGAGVAIALAVIAMRVGAEDYRILYADLDYGDAEAIIAELDAAGTPYRMRETGRSIAILVPEPALSQSRIQLAGKGILSNAPVGYELFDEAQTLGVTSFQQNLNRLRAMEGELARTIAAIDDVRSARVHLVLPERRLFARETERPSASIMVETRQRLASARVQAITNMVAAAVPGLAPSDVTVLDANGTLLAAAEGNDADTMSETRSLDRMEAAEARLRTILSDLVGTIVGPENVRVQVSADYDVSRYTETAEIIDPDSQVVLSTTLIEEESDDRRPGANAAVTIANSLPDALTAGDNDRDSATSQTRRSEEITNYELTKTVRNGMRDEGLVLKNLSVAVAVNIGNGQYSDAETLGRIENLVKSAVGFDRGRGDQLSVIAIPFAEPDVNITPAPASEVPAPLGLSGLDRRMIEIAALIMLAIALIVFVLRPLLAGDRKPTDPQTSDKPALEPASSVANRLTPVSGEPDEAIIDQKIDIAQIDGQVRASSIKQIQEIVKSHTDDSALVLKRWIREGA